jgi:hypothetical protein
MSLAVALENIGVINPLRQAWANTHQNNVEWGGWILERNGLYSARIKTDGQQSSIFLTRKEQDTDPLKNAGYTILADFHCHPGAGVASTRPSDADITQGLLLPYARLVFTYDSNHLYGNDLYRRALPRPTPDGFPDGAIMWQLH